MTRRVLVTAITLIALVTMLTGLPGGLTAQGKVVKIGLSLPLTGADAEAARPWLLMARERLTAETALDHVQELLTERLGGSPAAAPAKVPDEPQKARTRS